jgi:hypothetical protein
MLIPWRSQNRAKLSRATSVRLGLEALDYLARRRSPRELGMRFPQFRLAWIDLHMEKFEMRAQTLCDAERGAGNGFIAAPAASQYKNVLHAGLLRRTVLNAPRADHYDYSDSRYHRRAACRRTRRQANSVEATFEAGFA